MNLNLVEGVLTLVGDKISFVSLKLSQKFNEHHRCEVIVDFEELDKSFMNDPVRIIKNIGESLILEMKHRVTEETYVFKGIITNITMSGQHGQKGYVHIHAASETIRLEGQPTMDSFVNKNLEQIAYEVVSNSGNGAEVTIRPKYNKPIEYLCQWEESGHQFLNRLSSLYGEVYYNDGTTTYFGLPVLPETIFIKYDAELKSLNVGASLLPANFSYYNYIVEDDQEWQKSTRQEVPELTGYLKAAVDKADNFYTSEAIRPLLCNVGDSDSILNMTDINRTKTVAEMLTISGTSQTCKISIGKVIEVVYPEQMNVTTSAGRFLITEITHEIDQEGHYSNNFSGVRAALERVTTPQIPAPVISSQRATVVSNADPQGQGRVQVQFQWQKYIGKNTNWIRIQTPDAGSSNDVKANRGFVFIPEVGDTVVVGHDFGDPSQPFVQGSLFTSKVGGGGGSSNKIKSLTTRSGTRLTLDDEDKSAKLEDPSGNIVFMDGKGNITITAPNTLTINAKDINVNGGNSINIKAEPANEGGGEGVIDIKALKKMDVTIETEDITMKAKKNIDVTAETEDIKMTAKKNVDVTAETEDVKMTASAKNIAIKSAIDLNIEAPAKLGIKTTDMNIS